MDNFKAKMFNKRASSKSLSFRSIFKHHVAKETIIQEMKQAGYILEEEFDFLPEQHFTIHSKG